MRHTTGAKSSWVPAGCGSQIERSGQDVIFVAKGQESAAMAQGSQDQGAVGTANPEEDSPNMIVYRKTCGPQ
ncbi:hypothetical protein MATL_G00164070 [Megalops atlanticus]|uniref:Uncharacterized protein n=1 Tax=Megalops atlanticus TaxID=7932 RepID=A0A9D3T2G2_MEGAT|nr:hypothetical protein MATL_G00164070 [Megalops atlanticus]